MKTIQSGVSVQANARRSERYAVAKKLAALAVAISLTSAAFAAPETYVIDGKHTLPRFEYNHFGYSIQLSRVDACPHADGVDGRAGGAILCQSPDIIDGMLAARS